MLCPLSAALDVFQNTNIDISWGYQIIKLSKLHGSYYYSHEIFCEYIFSRFLKRWKAAGRALHPIIQKITLPYFTKNFQRWSYVIFSELLCLTYLNYTGRKCSLTFRSRLRGICLLHTFISATGTFRTPSPMPSSAPPDVFYISKEDDYEDPCIKGKQERWEALNARFYVRVISNYPTYLPSCLFLAPFIKKS